MITTNNDDLALKIRLMKNFGFSGYDNVIHIGTNGKMSEVAAAMGLTSLESLDEFVEVNHRNYKQYQTELTGLPGVQLIAFEQRERYNYQYIVLEIDEAVTRVNRDDLVEMFHAENVMARRYFYPGCHRMEPYRSYFPHAGLLLPHTERLTRTVMALPTGTAVGPGDIGKICEILKLAVENGEKLSARLARRRGTKTNALPADSSMLGTVRVEED